MQRPAGSPLSVKPLLPAEPQKSSAPGHSRRNVLLLLGSHGHALRCGIARYAREAGWMLESSFVTVGLVPVWWRGDGILALITNPKDAAAQRHFPKIPLVDFSKGWIADSMPKQFRAAGEGRPRVLYDNVQIGRIAADHFLERGFKHIAMLNYGHYWMENERLPSFCQTVERAGSQFYELEYYKCFARSAPRTLRDHLKAHRWLVRTLRQLPKPLGLAVASDSVALLVMRACDDAGLRIPEDVAVLGCHNDPLICDYAPVPLSSVDDDLEGLGYEGAKLLDGLMNGKRAPAEPVLIPPKGVVTRMSTDILAVPDPRVARGVRFIWEHYRENIGAPEVAAAAGLSRSSLDRVFFKYLGRSPTQEILNVRLNRAKNLLAETRLKAHEVAEQCGFSGIVHFSQAFQRAMGVRPSEFRRHHHS